MSKTTIAAGAVVIVLGLVLFGYLIFGGGSTGNMVLLTEELTPNESGAMVAELESAGIPAESRGEGTQIYVPSSLREQAFVALGTAGLLSGNTRGYEVFDESASLGETNFAQQIKAKRALEGELVRTIQTMEQIDRARVLLVLPQRELFARESREPSASVLVTLAPKQRLESQHVTAIQQIVAAAVPELKPTRISVADDRGRVYSQGVEDEQAVAIMRATQQRLDYERGMALKIEELVGQIVGQANVRAQVSAEMNFDRETFNEEEFDPDQQIARSVQTVEEEAESTETEGQDPVTVATNLPDADTAIATGAGSFSRSSRTEETTNFDIGRKVRSYVRETGIVRKLSVAVLINRPPQLNPEGEVARNEDGILVKQEIPEEQQAQIENLVATAAGLFLDQPRENGFTDNLEVMVTDFQDLLPREEEEANILGIPVSDLAPLLQTLALLVVAALIILLVVRPLISRAIESDEEGELPSELLPDSLPGPDMVSKLDETAEMEALEQMIDINQVEGRVRASSLRKIGEIVDKHPEEAVAILRTWMYQEA